MIKANVITESKIWEKNIKAPNRYINNKLKKLSLIAGFKKKKIEFTIFLSRNKTLKFLNKKYLNKNRKTDVLSFPLNLRENKYYIGDIAVSYEILKSRSKKTDFFYEFDRMWVHGLLHLYGYDHKKISDYYLMSKIEKRILRNFDHKFYL